MEHAEHEKAEKRYRPERFRRNPLARNGAVGDHDGGCRQQLDDRLIKRSDVP